MQKLVNLMRGYIGQNAAKTGLPKKPIGACGAVEPMRAQPHGLHHLSNRPFGHQLRRKSAGGGLEAFRKIHRPNPSGLRHTGFDLFQLRQRRAAGLVTHHIHPLLHRLDCQLRAVRWDGRDQGQIGAALQRRLQALKSRQMWKSLAKPGQGLRITFGPIP